MKRGWFFLSFIPILLFLSGCSSLVKGEQTASEGVIAVQPGHWIGQSFVAGYDGLSGIEVYIIPRETDHTLTLSLYSDALRNERLAGSTIEVKGTEEKGYYRFSFPPVKASNSAYFYFDILAEGNATLDLSTAAGDVYLDGSLYQDHLPQNAHLSFRLVYDTFETAKGLLIELLEWGWYWLLAGFVYVLPGWALLRLLSGETWAQRHWTDKLALSVGTSLAIYPVLLLWGKLANLSLGAIYSWAPAGLAVVYLVWKNRMVFVRLPRKPFHLPGDSVPADFIFIALLVMILLVRFWVIRGIDAPMWGDSYQHTMITQLIVDQGGLFDSWRPYVPYQSLTVQYGFSTGGAVWMWLTGMQSPQAILVFGQLLNVFAILSLYPLAVKLASGNRWAGNASLLIGGLLSTMPAMYVNWGRYAQLMGQAILPVALCLVWYWLENPRLQWKQLFIHGFALAGLLLSYYRMAFYYAAFIPVLFGLFWIRGVFSRDLRCWRTGFLKLAGIALLSLVFLIPWLLNVSGSNLSSIVQVGMVTQSPLEGVLVEYQLWNTFRNYVSDGLILLAAASLIISVLLKRWEVSGLILWVALVSAVKAGSLINLPGANLMQTFMVLISLYMFASLMGGWLIGLLVQRLSLRLPLAGTLIAMLLFLGLALSSLNMQRKIVNRNTYAIVTRPDIRAMEWIRGQTPPDSVFLVEGFRIYSGTTAVGSDGGWWISLLTLRQNTMPPQYALTNERPDPPDYTKKVVDLVAKLENHSPADPLMREDLCRWGITHIYVGQQQGEASIGKTQLYSSRLDQSEIFPLAYAQDRVRIYSIPSDYCQNLALQ